MMQITLSDTNGEFSIYLKEDFETLDDYIELLVKPVLRAAGFSDKSLDNYFVKEEEEFDLSFCEEIPNWELEPMEKKVKKTAKKYWE